MRRHQCSGHVDALIQKDARKTEITINRGRPLRVNHCMRATRFVTRPRDWAPVRKGRQSLIRLTREMGRLFDSALRQSACRRRLPSLGACTLVRRTASGYILSGLRVLRLKCDDACGPIVDFDVTNRDFCHGNQGDSALHSRDPVRLAQP